MNSIIPYSNSSSLTSNSEQSNPVVKYTPAIATTAFLGVGLLRFLLLSVLLVVAFVLWLWSISFQTGRLFGKWYWTEITKTEKPSGLKVTYKLGEIILFPFVLLRDWALEQIDKYWDIKLPLISETEPPQKCSELSLFSKKTGENQ